MKINNLLNVFAKLQEEDVEYGRKYLEIYNQNKSEIDKFDQQIKLSSDFA